MASMSRTTSSNSSLKGFSILQPFIGAPLCWMPAVGTKELDQLINAYLPGPGSAQEKRAAVSIDFFEYSAQTGESFKYYSVNAPQPVVNSSPTSSSSFTPSPAMSDLSYYGSPSHAASTPAPKMAPTASRKPAAKAESTDFSHLPGMKILTMDGQDVTSSVSRGCKTKEQREHAHLMRVLKACDACKRKKIRCDPSHKKRPSSQVKAAKAEATKPATKKARKSRSTPASQSEAVRPAPEFSFDNDPIVFDGLPTLDWDDLLTFNDDPVSAPVPEDFFFFGQENQFSPTISGSSGSFDSPAQPLTPVGSGVTPLADFTFHDNNTLAFPQADGQQPILPYLNPGAAHGSNYVDFNLFSPTSSFIDEEPHKLKAGEKRKASALQSQHTGANTASPAAFNESLSSTGLGPDQEWFFDHSGTTIFSPHDREWQVPDAQHQQQEVAGELGGGVIFSSGQLPFHADNDGHSATHAVTTTTRSRGLPVPHGLPVQPDLPLQHGRPLQQQALSRKSPTSAMDLLQIRERNAPLPEGFGQLSTTTTTAALLAASRVPSSQVIAQQDISPVGGNAQATPQQVSPTDLQAVDSSRPTPRQRNSTSNTVLPSRAPSTAVVPTSLSRQAEGNLQGGLLPAARLLPAGGLLPAGVLHRLSTSGAAATAANGSGLAAPFAMASRKTVEVHVQGSGSGSGSSSGLGLHRGGEGCPNGITATALSSPLVTGLCLSLPGQGMPGQGQEGQLLHSVSATANAASSSPQRRLSGEDAVLSTTSPVRQLPGRSNTTSSVLTQLVVFGLVSMLLIVAFTSQMQPQPPIFAYLPSRSLMIFLSLLSTLLAQSQHGLCLPSSAKSSAVHSVRSLFSGATSPRRRNERTAWTGSRVPLACF